MNEYISILDLLKSFPEWLEHVRLFYRDDDPLTVGYSDFCYSVMRPLPSYYKTIEEVETAMVEAEDGFFVLEIPVCSGSDYSGSLVERSNHKAIEEEYGDVPGCYTFHGGYDTFSIAFDLRLILIDGIGPIEELLRGLENYPLIDEDLHSTMEHEAEDECWASYGRGDFIRALEDSFSDFLEEQEHILQWYHGWLWDLQDIDDEKIDEFYYEQREIANECPMNEEGGSVHFPLNFTDGIDEADFKKLISYPSDQSLKAFHNQDHFKVIESLLHKVTVTPMVGDRDMKLNIIQGIVRILKGDHDHKQDLINLLIG